MLLMRNVPRLVMIAAVTINMVLCVRRAVAQSGEPAEPAQQVRPVTNDVPPRMDATRRYNMDFFLSKNPKTAMDMMNLLPGFSFSPGDSTVRGYSASAGNVVINGERPSNKQFTLDTILQNINADQVDYIEVIEVSRPGLEMLGQTIVANVVTKQTAGNATVASIGNAFFVDGRVVPSGSVQITRRGGGGKLYSGAFSISRYVELAEGQGPQVRTDNQGDVIQNAAIDSAAGGLTAYGYGVFSAPVWHGHLSVNGSAARTDYAYRENDLANPSSTSQRLREYLGGPLGGQLLLELGAHFNRHVGEKLTTESVILIDPNRQTYSSTSDSPGATERFLQLQHGGEALGRTNLRYAATANVTLETNAEISYNWLSTASSYFYNDVPVALPNAAADVSETRSQFSGHMAWALHKGLDLDFGAQVESSGIAAHADTDQTKVLAYLKPKFAVSFSPKGSFRLGLRVEHEVGQLNFTNFVAVSSLSTGSIRAGNTNIVPQQDWVFEFVPEYHFWSEGNAVFTFRHYAIADAIDRVPITSGAGAGDTFDAPGNIGSATENVALLSTTIPLDRFDIKRGQLRIAASRVWSSVTDPTTRQARPVTGLNPFEYSIAFRQDLPRWKADWGASFLTPCSASPNVKGCTEAQYRFDEIDSYRARPTINLFAEYLPGKGVSIRLEGDNVLQQSYSRVVSIFAGRRDAFPLAHQERRDLTSAASINVTLRKSF